MFGMGGSEIIFILIIALLFLGPDKLPEAAKQISKGIRDLKKQSRLLQQQIENDERIGGAIRDIKSALRGDEAPRRPAARKKPKPLAVADADAAHAIPAGGDADPAAEREVKLPPVVGEADPELPAARHAEGATELSAMIKPAPGAVAQGEASVAPAAKPESKHG
jgi:Sec-independent protein translocase protein TatA